VLLVHREGLSYREAAGVLGVSSGTVGWRLSVARGRLREELEEVHTYA
jgi:DNA-directed RNA polymerase specialized sigma24 family protein